MSEKKEIGVIAGLVKQTIEQHHAITNIQDPDERRVTEMIGQKVTFEIFQFFWGALTFYVWQVLSWN